MTLKKDSLVQMWLLHVIVDDFAGTLSNARMLHLRYDFLEESSMRQGPWIQASNFEKADAAAWPKESPPSPGGTA